MSTPIRLQKKLRGGYPAIFTSKRPDGKLIHQEALPHQMGIQQKELDVTAWDTGLYYLIIENSDKDVVVQWKLLIGD